MTITHNDSTVISVRIKSDMVDKIDLIAEFLDTNRNNLINKAIIHYLAMIEEFNNLNNGA